MPAESGKQRRAAAAALSAKQGGTPTSSLFGAALEMYESMTEEQLRDYARKPRTTKQASGMAKKKE